MTDTRELLARLIAFPSVSRASNLDLIGFVADHLRQNGIVAELISNEDGSKASLYAAIGPADVAGGVLLSGHTDVVPTDAQTWTTGDPFAMEERAGRLVGRGATDMKGFIASVLSAVPQMVGSPLRRPIYLAFSYDEEIGCVGVRPMLEWLRSRQFSPQLCIVGEPTQMTVATAHKGKLAARCTCRGITTHSALAPQGLNAIVMATKVIDLIESLQMDMRSKGSHDPSYSVPYSTLHVGTIAGGTALNIVPSECCFDFEIRNVPGDDPLELVNRLRNAIAEQLSETHKRFPQANIDVQITNAYPALSTSASDPMVSLVRELAQAPATTKLDFGTEAGLYQQALGCPVVVCGPGSMEQGHKADEFILVEQLALCDAFLSRLVAYAAR